MTASLNSRPSIASTKPSVDEGLQNKQQIAATEIPYDKPGSSQQVNNFEMYPVERVQPHSNEDHVVHVQRALTTDANSLENEAYLRTFHPSLSSAKHVLVARQPNGVAVWLVSANSKLYHTHAGGREIHILPNMMIPERRGANASELLADPIPRAINSRRILRNADLVIIRDLFPAAVGARLLAAGFLILLFKNAMDIQMAWRGKVPNTIGGLRLGFDVARYQQSKEDLIFGSTVSTSADFPKKFTGLGLRIRMPSGQSAITTPTHGFVKCVGDSFEQEQKTRKGILGGLFTKQEKKSVGIIGSDPVGQPAWVVGTSIKLGNILTTYDRTSSKPLPFPFGYRNDYSLIMGEHDVPRLRTSLSIKLTHWEPYVNVLDGAPVFVCRSQPASEPPLSICDTFSPASHGAVLLGTEHIWEKNTRECHHGLVWRTCLDQSGRENPGNILCCGNINSKTATAVLVENFEAIIRQDASSRDSKQEEYSATLKVGFFPPTAVRESFIEMDE